MIFSLQLIGATWSPPVVISAEGGFQPNVEFDSRGNAVAIWGTNTMPFTLQGASLPFQGVWSAPAPLSVNFFGSYDLAVTPEGNAVAVWEEALPGPVFSIHSASFIDGVWKPSITIKDPSGVISQTITVGVDDHGNAVAVWLDSANIIYWAALPAGDTSWTLPIILAMGTSPQVDVAPDGTAIAVWVNAVNQIDAAILPLGGGMWVHFNTISPLALTASLPAIEIDPNGNAVAIWLISTNLIQSSMLVSGATLWTNLQNIPTLTPPLTADLALDSHGNAIVAWQKTSDLVQSSTLPFGGAWTAPEVIANAGFFPEVAVDHHGNAVVVYSTGGLLYSSTRIVGGTWTEAILLSNPATPTVSGAVAVDLYGNALVVFSPFLSGPTQSRSLFHPSARIRSDRAFLRPAIRR